MSGWLILALLVALAAAAFWGLRVRGPLLQLGVGALLVGGAGYALQGRPNLGGTAAAGAASAQVLPLTNARRAFFGDFSGSEHWLIMSESMARRGKTADAAGVLRSAVREHPQDAALWIGLGNALVEHGRMLMPPAEFAFRRAAELAPGHPAPPFFLGLALARSGEREMALALWRDLLAGAPADASWRPLVEDAVAALTPPGG